MLRDTYVQGKLGRNKVREEWEILGFIDSLAGLVVLVLYINICLIISLSSQILSQLPCNVNQLTKKNKVCHIL